MPMLLALTALLATTAPRVEVVVPANIHAEPITGRVFVFFSHDSTPEPRLQAGGMVSVPFFGQDIDQVAAGTASVIDGNSQGYPLQSMTSLPAGDYYAQAIVSVYTKFARADGHTVWAHMDEWEGQQFNRAPGTLVSTIQRVHVDANGAVSAHFEISSVLPAVTVPADTKYVKYVKIQSQILTKWWGHPIFLGAVVLLPKGYDERPSEKYPAIWEQGHFSLQAPFGFTMEDNESPARKARRAQGSARESGAEFAKSWLSDGFPQMVAFRILHPSPYYDDSYAVNSANNGPYGDAIMQELIPYLETHYRVIRQPYARVLTGGSTGGWEALALQVYYPQFYGGTWVFYPDPVDFRRYEQVNIYSDTNAFWIHRNDFITQPRPSERLVDGQVVVQLHEENQLNNTRGSRRRGGENFAIWEAVFGPTDKDGYPAPIWNDTTGAINRDVAMYWRDHYDIRYYLDQNWSKVGPDLVGKLHIFCGDEDNYYLNLAVYLLQDFLEKTKAPAYGGSFAYGRPLKPHGWQPTTSAEMVRQMYAYIGRRKPVTQ